MAQRNQGRIDRFAQMSKQEELIAKKRQEILEKQRTAKLAKAVAAAQTMASKNRTGCGEIESDVLPVESVEDLIEENEEEKLPKTEQDSPKSLNSFSGKTGKISFGLKRTHLQQPTAELPPPKIINTFCNDGSFLENFKKILEKHDQPKLPSLAGLVNSSEASTTEKEPTDLNQVEPPVKTTTLDNGLGIAMTMAPSTTMAPQQQQPQQQHHHQQQQQQPLLHLAQPLPQPIPPPPPTNTPAPPAFAFQHNLITQAPPQMQLPTAFFHGAMPMQLHPGVAPPPPPPPPQIPIALANLTPIYMLPPDAMHMNPITAAKDFDLVAAIQQQKPPLNLEAIQLSVSAAQIQEAQQQLLAMEQAKATPPPPPPPAQPPPALPQVCEDHQHHHQQQQQQQQQQPREQHNFQITSLTEQAQQQTQETFHNDNESNCIKLPTTIENLIALVAEYGEDYEDEIRSHRSELHPAFWFLYDKNCEQYRCYRQQLDQNEQRQRRDLRNAEQLVQREQSQTEQYATSTTHAADQEVDKHLDDELQATVYASSSSSNNAGDKYDPESAISNDVDSDDEYMRGMMNRNRNNIKRRIESRNELSEEERIEREEAEREEQEVQRQKRAKRERKSRWGEKINENEMPTTSVGATSFGNQRKPMLSTITRSDPALLQYARLNYGSTQLSEEDWKKCEEHYKVNLLYQDMMRKRQEIDRLARNGKFKYEYDSDEDIEGGTWEHKLRTAEMEATQAWASALTKQSEGKHHIGDFLPPEELKKFMEQYEAKKNNRQPDLSDYKEYKLKEDNIGFQMLQKLGWKEGQGLGQDGAGIVDPVNKAPQRDGNQGLGVSSVAEPEECDNEYDAYRKRMMLAYRFRPNPLNNPRRAYY